MSVFIILGLLIFGAHLFSFLFSKKRIPDVLFLVLIGIAVGPVLKWVSPEDLSSVGGVFSSLTLLFILFDSGIDLKIGQVQKYWDGVFQITILSFIVSMFVAMGIAYLLGFDTKVALLLGAMLAGTSAAIVIPLTRQLDVSNRTVVLLTLESAISGVLSIVVSLAIIESFEMHEMSFGILVGKVLASVLLALVIGVVGGIVWASMLDRIRTIRNSMFLTPAFVFLLYGITETLGYSGAISSLAFGIVLGNVDYFEFSFLEKMKLQKMRPLEDNERSFFSELVFVFKTFFFVYVGICIPFNDAKMFLYGFLIAVGLYVARFVLIAIVGRKNTKQDRLVVSMMIPKGLVAAVLASMPEQVNLSLGYNLIPWASQLKSVAYAVIFFSICICSVLVILNRNKLVRADEPMADDGSVDSQVAMPMGDKDEKI